MAGRQRAAFDIELAAVDGPQRCFEAQAAFAVLGVFPRLQGAKHLGSEGFVDLVVIEVLQGQAIARQQAWHGIHRGHQQPFAAGDEIHRSGFAIDQVSQHLKPLLRSPFFSAQQHHRGPVGEWCGITRRQRALATAVEGGLELGQLLEGQVGTQIVVPCQRQKRCQQVVLPTLGIRGGQLLMAEQRQLVLLCTANAPGLGHALAMLAHRQARARFAIAWELGFQVVRPQLEQRFQSLPQAFATVGLQQDVAQPFVDGNRCIRSGIHAAGNTAVDLPQGNLVGHQQRRLKPGAAGLLDVVGRGLRRQARTQHTFAGKVHVT
ncbi:hypothetical protein D3C80_1193350 [compost metagenome]